MTTVFSFEDGAQLVKGSMLKAARTSAAKRAAMSFVGVFVGESICLRSLTMFGAEANVRHCSLFKINCKDEKIENIERFEFAQMGSGLNGDLANQNCSEFNHSTRKMKICTWNFGI